MPENGYVTRREEFEFLPGAIQAIAIIKKMGFLVIVITNQRGVARGFMTIDDLFSVHQHMLEELEKAGIVIDGIYFCPHETFENCDCRKPQPGMILRAALENDIDPAGSFMVGDSATDIAAGKKAGTRTVFLGKDDEADLNFDSLLDFAVHLRDFYEKGPSE